MNPIDYNKFAGECITELQVLQQDFIEQYDINGFENWHYDQHTGIFTFATGEQKLFFRYFEVGTYSTKSNTWMWAWHNSSIMKALRL